MSNPEIKSCDEAKKVRFNDKPTIIQLVSEENENPNEIMKDDRSLFIVDITISDGELVATVQNSKKADLRYQIPVRNIKHRVDELKEAVMKLNRHSNYFKFDQDVIKFVREITGKSPKELKMEKLMLNDPSCTLESRKRIREEEEEGKPLKMVKYCDETNEEKSENVLKPEEETNDENSINISEPELPSDESDHSFIRLIGWGFTASGEMLFRVVWTTGEKTWEPWHNFKDYSEQIRSMVSRAVRRGLTCTENERKAFETNTGMKLDCENT